ncbi:dihydrofolate reductase-like [Babylonia areolata]|uniref:dihydrofolate reductase-like n=1 Tax=Babylonia areolata TaxID=304850 RepID=UPI003FD35AC7
MATPKLKLVVAACNNGGIGIEGRIPWRIKQDLAFFKKITSTTQDTEKQNAVIMGRKTWFSIPEKFRPLPGRVNVVLSRELPEAPEGAHLARSLNDAITLLTTGPLASKVESLFVIGGSSVYEEAMTSDKIPCLLYLTRVIENFKCDTFIPDVDDRFKKLPNPDTMPEEVLKENGVDFKFELYEKSLC